MNYRRDKVGHHPYKDLLLKPEYGAFQAARNYYANVIKQDFAETFLHYLEDGFVVSRPHLFAMAKPIEWLGRRGWFIEFATGNILELMTCLPCALDFLAFRRDGGDLRVVKWDYFIKKLVSMNKKEAK